MGRAIRVESAQCAKNPTRPATYYVVLGGCLHKNPKGIIIKRHNDAVLELHEPSVQTPKEAISQLLMLFDRITTRTTLTPIRRPPQLKTMKKTRQAKVMEPQMRHKMPPKRSEPHGKPKYADTRYYACRNAVHTCPVSCNTGFAIAQSLDYWCAQKRCTLVVVYKCEPIPDVWPPPCSDMYTPEK